VQSSQCNVGDSLTPLTRITYGAGSADSPELARDKLAQHQLKQLFITTFQPKSLSQFRQICQEQISQTPQREINLLIDVVCMTSTSYHWPKLIFGFVCRTVSFRQCRHLMELILKSNNHSTPCLPRGWGGVRKLRWQPWSHRHLD